MERVFPIAVANPAPNKPSFKEKTKKKSAKTLKIPPIRTATVAKVGLESLRRKAARIWENK